MTCQLSYLPLETENYQEEVDAIIDQINQYEVETEVSKLSTTVKGDRDEIMKMIDDIYQRMDSRDKVFRFHVELLSTNN